MRPQATLQFGVKNDILATIGSTPIVRLGRMFEGAPFEVFAKLEGFNPGGSIKDRAALTILRHALEAGLIGPSTVVVESSSGNMGIGLAQACRLLGLRFVCVVDPKTTRQNLALLRAYGAEVDLVETPDPATGEFLGARIDRVRTLVATLPNAYWPDQYSNPRNVLAHHETMREIVGALGRVDYLVCSTSTCGTVRGCAEHARAAGLSTRIVAVDAVGSVIFGQPPSKRLIPGHGAAVRPTLVREELVDRVVHVTDLECVVACRRLARLEAILAGGSSGAVVSAVERLRPDIEHGATVAVILPDRGERYVDTVYSDVWVREHMGDVARLWERDEVQ